MPWLSADQALSKGWPTKKALKEGQVFIDEDVLQEIKQLLEEKRLLLVIGAEGRGKTVLAKTIVYRKVSSRKPNWRVWYCDLADQSEGVTHLLRRITRVKRKRQPARLFVIENANFNYDAVTALLQAIGGVEEIKARFLFTSRALRPEMLGLYAPDPFNEWKREHKDLAIYRLSPTSHTIESIIRQYMAVHKDIFKGYEPPDGEFRQDLEWIENEVANNLRRLSWYLDAWLDNWSPDSPLALRDVSKEKVLIRVVEELIAPLGGLGLQEETLLKVAAVFQYGVAAKAGSEFVDQDAVTELAEKGLIELSRGHLASLAHPTDAAYIVEAVAWRERSNPARITIKNLQQYVKQRIHPPTHITSLFRALYQEREREVLRKIIHDDETFNLITIQVAHADVPVRDVFSTLGFINWADPSKSQIFWESYKRSFGKELKEREEKIKANLLQLPLRLVAFSLNTLYHSQPSEAKHLVQDVLSVDDFITLAADVSFGSIYTMLNLLIAWDLREKAQAILEKLDPYRLGEKAQRINLQTINWFLRIALPLPGYARAFLGAHGIENLLGKLRSSPGSVVSKCKGLMRKADCDDMEKQLDAELTPDDWINIWERSGISWISNQLWRYLGYKGQPRRWAQEMLDRFATRDLRNFIRESRDPKERKLNALGKFIFSAYQLNRNAAKSLAQQVAEYVDLESVDRYTLEELSLLVRNISKCANESAYCKLLERIRLEVDLSPFVTIPLDKALSSLLWDLNQCNKPALYARELLSRILDLDLAKLLNESELDSVNLLLWNALQIDHTKTEMWINGIEESVWVRAAMVASSLDVFWLLWTIYQADESLSYRVAQGISSNFQALLQDREVRAEDLPLLGLLAFYGFVLDSHLRLPQWKQLLENPFLTSVAPLAFSIRALQTILQPDEVAEFISQLADRLAMKEIPLQELLDKYPFPQTREILEEPLTMVANLVPEKMKNKFAEMILLTQTYFEEQGVPSKKEPYVPFGKLVDFLTQNPSEKPLFTSREETQAWIELAMKYEIFRAEEVPHFKIPEATVTLLYLNRSNPLVVQDHFGLQSFLIER